MDIKIQPSGCLQIKRAGIFKPQYCPNQDAGGNVPCSDWCPHFGELSTYQDEDATMDMLQICNGRYLIGTVTDERIKAEAGK